MTDDELRRRIAAAFPSATITWDLGAEEWTVTFCVPLDLGVGCLPIKQFWAGLEHGEPSIGVDEFHEGFEPDAIAVSGDWKVAEPEIARRIQEVATEIKVSDREGVKRDLSPVLHLYPQETYHARARIVGEPAALRALGEALIAAAKTGNPRYIGAMAADGEGYCVHIWPTTAEGAEACGPHYAQIGQPWDFDGHDDRTE